MTRSWPPVGGTPRTWPNPSNGVTLCHITDTHVGQRDETDWRFPTIAADMERLGVTTQGVVHTGDMCDWDETPPTGSPEVSQYRAWRDPLRTALGVPWSEVPGNHDLQSFQSRKTWTSQQWATAMGYASANTVTIMGGVWVIGTAPPQWAGFDGDKFTLDAATLTWLDQQLTAAGSNPVIITAHVPPVEQYPSAPDQILPAASFANIVGSHSNVKMILSGHRHSNIWTDNAHSSIQTIGGKKVFCLNGPAAGGIMFGYGDPYTLAPWRSPCLSTYVTYYGDAVGVRWRDQMAGRWSDGLDGDTYKHYLIAA